MYDTRYHRPQDLASAVALFGEGEDARFLAGGQTLIPTMKQRLAAPTDLIDLTRLPELAGIAIEGDALMVGAAATHASVGSSETVRQAIPGLASLAGMIGDPAVRHRGTIGGSVANNDPAADYPAAVLALAATIHTDKRSLPADDFFQGMFSTALDDGEVIVRVAFQIPDKSAYAKFPNPASGYPMAGVFVARLKDGAIRVGVTGASGDGVFRAHEIEQALTANFNADSLDPLTLSPEGMLSDMHGSAAYRANLVKVMAKRAVAQIA